MRVKNLISLCLPVLFLITLSGCERETEEFKSEALQEYMPLVVGKYITYRIDSTVFTNLGRNEEIHKYQVKHQVDAQVTDNLGRASFRIIRYLRDSAGTQPWVPNGTYFITPLTDQIETIEDNLRFIKLHLPIRENFKWKGNRHLSSDPFNSLYNLSNDDNMNDWESVYARFSSLVQIGGQAINNVYTVSQIDEALNAPVTDPNSYGARTLSREQYAKNIGLVTRDFILWEYQPNTGGAGGGFRIGFGIKMWMIDRN